MTLFRYSIEDYATKNLAYMCGPKWTKPLYLFWHFAWVAVWGFAAFIMYNSFYLSTTVITIIHISCTYNGGNYYMEWVAKKYERKIQKLDAAYKKKMDEKETESDSD